MRWLVCMAVRCSSRRNCRMNRCGSLVGRVERRAFLAVWACVAVEGVGVDVFVRSGLSRCRVLVRTLVGRSGYVLFKSE